jgi:hypothetical protein
MDPRFRGGDELRDFHFHGWVADPWQLLGMTGQTGFSAASKARRYEGGRSPRDCKGS